jgi:two-component system response regulator YesN
MLKLIVVEDNLMTLNYLKQSIAWGDHGIQLVGTYSNGQRALEGIEENHPDIILTDIRMPGMDGLQLTETVKKRWSHITIIILTAYDHFEYSQRALKAGACDYILKPLDDDELFRVIHDVRETIMEFKKKQAQDELLLRQIDQSIHLLQQDFFVKLITGYFDQSEYFEDILHFLKLSFPDCPYLIAVFVIDDLNHLTGLNARQKQGLLFQLKEYIEVQIPIDSFIHVFFYHDQLVMLKHFTDGDIDLRAFTLFCSNVNSKFRQDHEYTVSTGISYDHRSLRYAKLAYDEASSSLDHRFFIGKGCIIFKGDLVDDSARPIIPIVDEMKIRALTISGNVIELAEQLERMKDHLQQNGSSVEKIKSLMLSILFQCLHQYREFGLMQDDDKFELNEQEILNILHCETFNEVFTIFHEKMMQISKRVMDSRQSRSNSIIHQAVSYVSNHYDQELSIEKIAKHVGLNDSYFSHLFKKVHGISFTHFITKIRIEKSLFFLKNPDIKISDISELVGIQNPRYFAQLFKKQIGITPSEYRNKLKIS